MMADHIFKKCPYCGVEWKSRDHFLQDPCVDIIGYQPDFKELTLGLFYFNHSCKGTLTVRAGDFEDLYDGPIFKPRAAGTADCDGYCRKKGEPAHRPAHCECAYVREVIRIIKSWRKDAPGQKE